MSLLSSTLLKWVLDITETNCFYTQILIIKELKYGKT
jgi:hypothetical protein